MIRYVLSAPTPWIEARPGETLPKKYLYWCGGCRWDESILNAAAFASMELAKEHASALNLREWNVTTHDL